jgi:uncharacterized Fe-S cluster-containing MiaB family protein
MATTEEILDEQIRIAKLRGCVDATIEHLRRTHSFDEARRLIEETRAHILQQFPDKSHVFELVLRPRFNRIIDERLSTLEFE